MIAIDTNLLVRIVVDDDPAQRRAATALLERHDRIWLSKTVLLELIWVLSFSYQLERERIVAVLERLLGFAPLVIEDRAAVEKAVPWYASGLDPADALHLASSRNAEALFTLDRALVSRSQTLETQPPACVVPAARVP